MSSDMDQPMGPWGNIAPDFWAITDQTGGTLNGRNASIAPPDSSVYSPRTAAASAAPASVPLRPGGQHTAADTVPGPPPQYAARLAAVCRALESPEDAAGLAAAAADAEMMDQEITDQFGEVHSHTVSIREVRGWLALESGQPQAAARWYLHTAGLQSRVRGPQHPLTARSAEQAVYAWTLITDPGQSRALGTAVLEVLRQITGDGDRLAAHVRRRLTGLSPLPGSASGGAQAAHSPGAPVTLSAQAGPATEPPVRAPQPGN